MSRTVSGWLARERLQVGCGGLNTQPPGWKSNPLTAGALAIRGPRSSLCGQNCLFLSFSPSCGFPPCFLCPWNVLNGLRIYYELFQRPSLHYSSSVSSIYSLKRYSTRFSEAPDSTGSFRLKIQYLVTIGGSNQGDHETTYETCISAVWAGLSPRAVIPHHPFTNHHFTTQISSTPLSLPRLFIMAVLNNYTNPRSLFTLRAFSGRFYPKWLSISTFVRRRRTNNILVSVQ